MANWLRTLAQSLIGIVHFLLAFFSAKCTDFFIELSFGNTPLFLMIFLICRLIASMALVVQMAFLINSGKAKHGII